MPFGTSTSLVAAFLSRRMISSSPKSLPDFLLRRTRKDKGHSEGKADEIKERKENDYYEVAFGVEGENWEDQEWQTEE